MANTELLSEHQRVQKEIAADKQRAEQRRQAALVREKRLSKEREAIPTEVNARNSTLIAKKIRYLPQDMIIKLPLDTPKIKIMAFDHYEHIGNATYAITAILPISSSRKEIETVQAAIQENFKKNVTQVILDNTRFFDERKKNSLPTTDLDKMIQRAEKPPVFKFRTRTPESTMFLNCCYQADLVANNLLKLAHLNIISQTEYMKRVEQMAEGLHRYASFVYMSRRKAFEKMQRLADKDENTKKELNSVKQEVRDAANIELNDNGELKELSKAERQESANNESNIADAS
ncbi:hypothetical protein [Succinivibrio dextrinosolvens]|uniref:hypothetical protein n=1 Tax=Succinivibrio dextrinosolvens TaxID=83771 RepID=UPI00241DFF17|nr:hypothetical protein [Succinivibrio dextrinosolvens]MBE6423109.1 hypothetical protein [Succinivibrio dextrinosolvens]